MWCVSASFDRRRAMFARPLLVVLRVASTASARAAATNQSNWPSAGCARLPSPLKFYAWEGSAMLGRIRAGSPPPLLSGAVCGAQGHHHSTQLDRGHSLDRSLTRSIGVTRSIIHSQSNPGRWHGQGTGEDDPPRPHTDGLPPVVGGGCGWTLGTAKAQVGMSALSHRDRERERQTRPRLLLGEGPRCACVPEK